ncbi:hypothetical protein D3C80_1893090 [compost metagenome]
MAGAIDLTDAQLAGQLAVGAGHFNTEDFAVAAPGFAVTLEQAQDSLALILARDELDDFLVVGAGLLLSQCRGVVEAFEWL